MDIKGGYIYIGGYKMKCKHKKRIENCYECFWNWQNTMIKLGKLIKKEKKK